MDEPTIACSLGAEDYVERLLRIRKLGGSAFLDIGPRPDGATVSFRKSDQVRDELSAIIEAETACCSFLELSLHSEGEQLTLVITGPPGAMPVVRDLRRASRASSQADESFAGDQEAGSTL